MGKTKRRYMLSQPHKHSHSVTATADEASLVPYRTENRVYTRRAVSEAQEHGGYTFVKPDLSIKVSASTLLNTFTTRRPPSSKCGAFSSPAASWSCTLTVSHTAR